MLRSLIEFDSLSAMMPFYRFLVSSSSFQFSSYLTKNPNKTMNKVWKNIKSRKNCREFPVFEFVTDRFSTWVILFGNLIPQLEGSVCISGWHTWQVLWSYRNIVRHGKHETNKERANGNEILFSVFIRFNNYVTVSARSAKHLWNVRNWIDIPKSLERISSLHPINSYFKCYDLFQIF